MKLKRLIIATTAMMIGAVPAVQAKSSSPTGPAAGQAHFSMPQVQQHDHADHGTPHSLDKKAPMPQRERIEPKQLVNSKTLNKQSHFVVKAAATCNVNAFATTNSTTLINEIKTQGASCVNELFSAASSIQVTAFDSNNMYQVANHTSGLAGSYVGNGDPDLEALYLYLRAGYYAEYYNPNITFISWVKPAVKGAIDSFVNNSHFYDNNDNHGKVLQEVIIAMDSTEQQDVYLPVVKEWLSRWNQSYAANWNMRSAVNGIFTILFRGQYNSNFVSQIGSDTTLVSRLRSFSESTWMVNSDAEYMIANAARELGRLKNYSGTSIQSSVDAALNSIFNSMGYQMYGYGDAVWLGAADTANYYGNCADYGICGYEAQLEGLALSQTYTCSSTIKIRSQNMTAVQHSAACSKMGYEENYFHSKLQTGGTPISGDQNTQLQVNIFDSSTDYGKYGGPIFGINTNNGGMYLEGDPSAAGNIPNFVAYEASYANPDHYVWNLEHEYVHYLDGRFNLDGSFAASTTSPYSTEVVWWSEGVAEYIANENNNQAAYDTIHDGSTYDLPTIFATNYDGFDQDRIYRWGYLAVRFMFERHANEVQAFRAEARAGSWDAVQTRFNNWASSYNSEFTSWLQTVTPGDTNPPDNVAPTAVANGPYSGSVNAAINFDSSGSSDSDGTIASYNWNFGDGATSTAQNPSHAYTSAGTYTATLTVTDNGGLSNSATATVTVNPVGGGSQLQNGETRSGLSGSTGNYEFFYIDVPANASDLNISISGGSGDADLYVRFGSQPTDSSFDCRPYIGGNSETCSEAAPAQGRWHIGVKAYSAYSGVSLTASYTTGSQQNIPPVAVANGPYTSDVNVAVNFNSSGSYDSDGSIASYSWDFGDGTSSTSANPSHSYSSAGSYTVSLTVTDDKGETDTITTTATINEVVGGTLPNTCATQGATDYVGLESGVPVCVTSGSGGNLYFYFYNNGASQATISTEHGTGNADLYYSSSSWPQTNWYQQSSTNSDNTETIQINNLASGWNYILINGTHSGMTIQLDMQ